MKLEWMEPYRDIVGNFYRSANGYSQICKSEIFGGPVPFSPYEVQIIEHILEHAEEHRNMKWYASRLGLSQATYSKYVQKLVDKGLLEKYHTSGNKKDVILMVSPLGLQEYRDYTAMASSMLFADLFSYLGSISAEELKTVKQVFSLLGRMHAEKRAPNAEGEETLIRVK